MGIDAEIYFRLRDGAEVPYITGFPVGEANPHAVDVPEGATHYANCGGRRFYGIYYERGPWPDLAAALMKLLASEDVETVWYGGDHGEPPVFTAKDLLEVTEEYLTAKYRRKQGEGARE